LDLPYLVPEQGQHLLPTMLLHNLIARLYHLDVLLHPFDIPPAFEMSMAAFRDLAEGLEVHTIPHLNETPDYSLERWCYFDCFLVQGKLEGHWDRRSPHSDRRSFVVARRLHWFVLAGIFAIYLGLEVVQEKSDEDPFVERLDRLVVRLDRPVVRLDRRA